MDDNEKAVSDYFLILDEEDNAIDYLEKAIESIGKIRQKKSEIKWAAIALFGALYGFAVAAVKGTDSRSVLDAKGKVLGFSKIIDLCQNDKRMKMTIVSEVLRLSENQKEAIKTLKDELRNNFEHFAPMHWAVSVDLFNETFPEIMEIIRFLSLKTGNYVLLNEEKRRVVERLFDSYDKMDKGIAT